VKLGAAWDYAQAHDNSYVAPGALVSNHGYAHTIALYASLQATEKLSFHARAEWAKLSGADFPGSVVGPVPPADLGTAEIYGLTGTIQYDLWANVLSRLEIRWDYANEGSPFGGTVTPGKKDEILAAANIIYKF
jgi:hypothetical protein